MNRRGPGGRQEKTAGSHHISSVAHHFLEQERGGVASSPPARGILVGAAADARASAFAAAGLLAALDAIGGDHDRADLPDRSGRVSGLTLFESDRSPWSATAYLDSARLEPVPDESRPEGIPAGWSDAAWRFCPAGGDESSVRRGNRYHLCHVGAVSENLLEWFELRRVVQASGLRPGLVWCLRRDEALALTRAHALGRILASLEPDPIEILVFPSDWDASAGEGLLDRFRRLTRRADRPTPQLAAEIENLFRCLLPRGELNVSMLQARPGIALAGTAAEILQDAARRLAVVPTSP